MKILLLAALYATAAPRSAGDVAVNALYEGRLQAAYELARPAEGRDPLAAYVVASLFDSGGPVAMDKAEAARRFRALWPEAKRKADAGNAEAMFVVGSMLLGGEGVKADLEQAFLWYRKSAEAGYAPSQTGLGNMYYLGQHVPQDARTAVAWFEKAAAQGYANAHNNLATAYTDGEGVDRDPAKAVAHYRSAADRGVPTAMLGLAWAYLDGAGVPQDAAQARSWLEKAAGTGHAGAQNDLGVQLAMGAFGPPDYVGAERWFRRAANQGHGASQYNLGFYYEEGMGGLPRSMRDALAWYGRAARQGYFPDNRQKQPDDLWDRAVAESKEEERRKAAAPPALTAEQAAAVAEAAVQRVLAAATPAAPAPAPASGALAPSFRGNPRPHDFAVVVGVEKYSGDLPEAAFAERDARAVREHLLAMGLPERNVILLEGSRATSGALKKTLETWLPNQVTPESTVFVYFSGHGAPDAATRAAFLVPWDGDPQYLADTAYPVARLYEKLRALKARRAVALLDACFSGRPGRSVLAKGTRPMVVTVEPEVGPGVVMLSASAGDEVSGSAAKEGYGLFTYHLLRALNSAPSGPVTLKTVFDALKPAVQDEARRENRSQTPQAHGDLGGVVLR